jgi:hypothetical protein
MGLRYTPPMYVHIDNLLLIQSDFNLRDISLTSSPKTLAISATTNGVVV